MRVISRLLAGYLLACLLALSMTGCGSTAAVEAPLSAAPPPPSGSPVATVQPTLAPSTPPPTQPGEDTRLTYSVDGEEITVPAREYLSELGCSMVYDTEHYVCNVFHEGVCFWANPGHYLSLSRISDMPVEDVLAGLRLQENIAMEPESVLLGAEAYTARTVYLTTDDGLYRQFWALPCGGDVLLLEQSYDTLGVDAAMYRASQSAMVDTFILTQ